MIGPAYALAVVFRALRAVVCRCGLDCANAVLIPDLPLLRALFT